MKIYKLVKNTSFYIYFVLVLTFFSKLYNLNYNSPSGDESVYIAAGHSILFNWNWALYNVSSWLGGHAYFYPILSSIGYFYNGIIGSRLINVFFSVLTTYFVYLITEKILKRSYGGLFKNRVVFASIVSSIIFAFSYSTIYISRLATYDMPSFAMLIVGVYFLIDLCDRKYDDQGKAKHFFLASIFLSLSFAFKYISILYIPLIIVTSYLYIFRYFKKSLLRYWLYYFLLPLVIMILILSISQFSNLVTYIDLQLVRENFNVVVILSKFFENVYSIIPFVLFSLIYLIYKKRYGIFTFYAVSLLIVLVFHLLTGRVSAIEKHSIYFIFTGAVFSGFVFYKFLRKKYIKIAILILVFTYSIYNLLLTKKIDTMWPNYNTGLNYLKENMKDNDRLLSENSASLIVSPNKDFSNSNIVTFDWFEYKKLNDYEAYEKAIMQGYFNYIELETDKFSKPSRYLEINEIVKKGLKNNYSEVLKNEYYVIYKRVY